MERFYKFYRAYQYLRSKSHCFVHAKYSTKLARRYWT